MISRALTEARRSAGEEERLRLGAALEALEQRHEVPAWVAALTRDYLDRDDRACTEWGRAWIARGLEEYLAPGTVDVPV